jgi:NAD-dependent glycerol-3-phosphate dehydrogenase N-terminus
MFWVIKTNFLIISGARPSLRSSVSMQRDCPNMKVRYKKDFTLTLKLMYFDADRVTMYVFEEMIEGKKLTEIINTTHENVKYLPGHKLPENIVSHKLLQLSQFRSC